jgi:hypothetical protein
LHDSSSPTRDLTAAVVVEVAGFPVMATVMVAATVVAADS